MPAMVVMPWVMMMVIGMAYFKAFTFDLLLTVAV